MSEKVKPTPPSRGPVAATIASIAAESNPSSPQRRFEQEPPLLLVGTPEGQDFRCAAGDSGIDRNRSGWCT